MFSIKITLPYDPELSKNKRFAGKFASTKFPNSKHKKAQAQITALVKQELQKNPRPIKGRVNVVLIWFRENMRGDVSNFVNPINDAIRDALDFDDNLFSGIYNWVVDKDNPRFEITITFSESEAL
jgi:Holliday junction resolvase RusA-like endonuclease